MRKFGPIVRRCFVREVPMQRDVSNDPNRSVLRWQFFPDHNGLLKHGEKGEDLITLKWQNNLRIWVNLRELHRENEWSLPTT